MTPDKRGYTMAEAMVELGVSSRQTIYNLRRSTKAKVLRVFSSRGVGMVLIPKASLEKMRAAMAPRKAA